MVELEKWYALSNPILNLKQNHELDFQWNLPWIFQHRAPRRQLQDLQPVHISTFGAASSSLRVNVGSDGSVVTWGKGGHRVDAYHGIGHMSQKVA